MRLRITQLLVHFFYRPKVSLSTQTQFYHLLSWTRNVRNRYNQSLPLDSI